VVKNNYNNGFYIPEKNISANIEVSNFILATHPELRATKRSNAATTEAEEEQIGSATAGSNSPVLLYLAMIRDAG
jgi:hypothetical protein